MAGKQKRKTKQHKNHDKHSPTHRIKKLAEATTFIAIASSLLLLTMAIIENEAPKRITTAAPVTYLRTTIGATDTREIIPSTIPSEDNNTGTSTPQSATSPSPGITTTTVTPQVAPAAGLPETIILISAVLLGVLGSVSFIVLKLLHR